MKCMIYKHSSSIIFANKPELAHVSAHNWMVSCWLVGWLDFMTYQPLEVIYRQIHFYLNNQLYLKKNLFSMSTQFNGQKHFYFKVFSLDKQF